MSKKYKESISDFKIYESLEFIQNEIKLFIKNSIDKKFNCHAHIRCPYTETILYVRKGYHLIENNIECCFDIASINIDENVRGKGFFQKILKYIKENCPWKFIFIESILNIDFEIHLIKNGFKYQFNKIYEIGNSVYMRI